MNLKVPIATESRYLHSILPNHRGEEVRISLGEIYKNYINSPEYRLIDAIKKEEADSSLVLQRIKENNEKNNNKEVKQVGEVIDEIAIVFLGTLTIMKEVDRFFPGMIGERIEKSVKGSEEKGWMFKNSLNVWWD